MKMKPWLKTIAVCVLIFAVLAGYKAMKIRAAIAFGESFPEPSETVESVYPSVSPYAQTLLMTGVVVAPKNVALYSELPGRITAVGFISGESVQAGQVLLQLDISEEQAQLASANARLDLAQSVYNRNKKLYASRAVSEEQFDRARVDLAMVEAEIEQLKATIRKKTIIAPFAGKTGIHQFEVGSFVLDNVLITHLVSEENYAWVDFTVPQFYPALENGATIEVQRLRRTSNDSQNPWVAATIIARSPQVDSQNRSFQYRAKVDAKQLDAGINSGVSILMPVTEQKNLITVPATAVLRDNLGQYVYVLHPNGKDDNGGKGYRAERRDVVVAAIKGQHALLHSGLTGNELLASNGAFKLIPSILVYSEPQNTPASLSQSREG